MFTFQESNNVRSHTILLLKPMFHIIVMVALFSSHYCDGCIVQFTSLWWLHCSADLRIDNLTWSCKTACTPAIVYMLMDHFGANLLIFKYFGCCMWSLQAFMEKVKAITMQFYMM
ncbi:uncharacterized protein LOC5520519 isoform X2 [Nematostella vectensis]|uniref:uncharacterized protein LOC5520519 isoform X2 n=2 Tax=Nematostella vectensis TaxID=45351 RepID=UPI0020776D48|nr:uncharacterized protein LOC5520519 isoform X2 [Nematostella vectensis]